MWAAEPLSQQQGMSRGVIHNLPVYQNHMLHM